MNQGPSCPLVKPGKESARNCARALLTKVMMRDVIYGQEENLGASYTPDEIEKAIFDNYPTRDTYLAKIAKVVLHLSLFTRTGMVSWTFQNAIFNRGETSIEGKVQASGDGSTREDYLEWLMTRAEDEDVFPELYKSWDFVVKLDRQNFEQQMYLEHDAILQGLQEIVRVCCDAGTCDLADMNTRYEKELFKAGSLFATAARKQCMSKTVDFWVPPSQEIFIPDTIPMVPKSIIMGEKIPSEISTVSTTDGVGSTQDLIVPRGDNQSSTGLQTTEPAWHSLVPAYQAQSKVWELDLPIEADSKQEVSQRTQLNRERTIYTSQSTTPDLNRNFGTTTQVTCFDIPNLIHNLAILEPGKLLELPWDGSLLDGTLQDDLYDKFRVEIGMRRFFLSQYYQ